MATRNSTCPSWIRVRMRQTPMSPRTLGIPLGRPDGSEMLSFKILAAALLAGGALLAAAAFAQGTGRWTIGTLMPSARTEVAVAEVGGKIYVVGGFGGERELEVYDPAADRWSRG